MTRITMATGATERAAVALLALAACSGGEHELGVVLPAGEMPFSDESSSGGDGDLAADSTGQTSGDDSADESTDLALSWSRRILEDAPACALSLAPHPQRGVVAAGWVDASKPHVWLAHIDESGDVLWSDTIDRSGNGLHTTEVAHELDLDLEGMRRDAERVSGRRIQDISAYVVIVACVVFVVVVCGCCLWL